MLIKKIKQFYAPISLGADAKQYFLEQYFMHAALSVKYAMAAILLMFYIELDLNNLVPLLAWTLTALLIQFARYIITTKAIENNAYGTCRRPFVVMEWSAGIGWIVFWFVVGLNETVESSTLWRMVMPFFIMAFYMDTMRFSIMSLLMYPTVLYLGLIVYLGWFNLIPADVKSDYMILGFVGTAVLLHYGRASHLLSYDTFNIIQQNKALIQAMDDMLIHDDLTKQHNRRYFDEQLSRHLSLFERANHPFCIAILDIDHFKHINDMHGHATGDAVLVALSAYANNALRTADIFARYGGEEFALLLPMTDLDAGLILLDRLRMDVESRVFDINNKKIGLTISIGVAMVQKGETGEQLLGRADHALYAVKNNGRNQVRVATHVDLNTEVQYLSKQG